MSYQAPLKDMRFVLKHIAGLDEIAAVPAYAHATPDVVEAALEEAAKLAQDVWSPLNVTGDRQGLKIADGAVKPPDGFKDAYKKFYEGGWNGFTCPQEFGGQALPVCLGMAVNEMWQASNLSLGLCPLLTQAAIDAIVHHGTEADKALYLEKLVSGAWTGTMHLTEPQAGSDLAAIRTVAKKNGDHYLITGQKIFITWGEHDFTENIIHMVLARVDGLPEGNDGLGLFIVPKFLVNADGSLGKRNDVKAVSLEHKLGIHASPTCVMAYGEQGGAVAYLAGKEGAGLRNMFTMMNAARIGVGVQGVSLCDRSYQHALHYAKNRVQSVRLGDKSGKRAVIIAHPDVRRMLMTMKAQAEAARALTYYAGGMIDRMKTSQDMQAAARVDLLTPLVKAWATDMAVENSSLGVQIHGGMGFIEETGAAQYYRDARILPIYEGTNGIQSNDLVFRKVLRDQGAEAQRLIDEMKDFIKSVHAVPSDDLAVIVAGLTKAIAALEETTRWILANGKAHMESVAASAQPYQRQFSLVAGSYMMARMAAAALAEMQNSGADVDFYNAKLITARFFTEALLPAVHGLSPCIMGGNISALQMTEAQF